VSSTTGRATATYLNFYVSHGSATRFLRNGDKYYMYFIDNLMLFSTVHKSQNRLTVDEVIAKKFDTTFFF